MIYKEIEPNVFEYEYEQGKVILKFKDVAANFQIYVEDDNTVHVNILKPGWKDDNVDTM